MNIKITYNWLCQYLKTEATPFEIQKYLSLSGPSIEAVNKIGDDYLFDIEIISNRIDTACVLGIAQEAVAILPVYGKKAELKVNPFQDYSLARFKNKLKIDNRTSLVIDIKGKTLCSRLMAVVIDDVKIGPSPDFIKKYLSAAGINIINNVVDISNYLMLTFGQPVHIFDFDRIQENNTATLIMREAKKGEKVIILDGREVILPGEDIVLEDGKKRLIDLCGIMGGLSSAVNEKTKRIILFVQTYNKTKIRKTCMSTGVRTLAASYFEKGLDEERVEPTIIYGIELLQRYADGQIASKIYNFYPHPYKQKIINLDFCFFKKVIGFNLDKQKIVDILNSLSFKTKVDGENLAVSVPPHRKNDIAIPEDLVEEVARIYGYDKIPSQLPPACFVEPPAEAKKLFKFIFKVKLFLKHLGLTEVINYSMISKKMINQWGLDEKKHLRLANSISEEIEYMRTTLLPSLYKNVIDNLGKREKLKFFEIAKVYQPHLNELPEEQYRLAIAVNTDYFDLKGIIEALLKELNIKEKKVSLPDIVIKDGVYLFEINLSILLNQYSLLPQYQPPIPYSTIKLDLTIPLSPTLNYKKIENFAFQVSGYLKSLKVVDLYKNKLTVRFYFQNPEKNMTEDEAKKELEKIKTQLLQCA